MSTIRAFNSTVFDLINELTVILPDLPEVGMAKLLASTYFDSQPDGRLVVDKFWEHAKDHQDKIRSGDSEAMISALKIVVPRPELVDKIYAMLSPENRSVVASYVSVLFEQAQEIIKEVGETPVPTGPQGHHLFSVYNNMWIEFLKNVAGGVRQSDDVESCITRLQQLLDAQGMDSNVVFELVSASVCKLTPPIQRMDEKALMQSMMPPSDPLKSIKQDKKKIGKERFVLAVDPSYTWGSLLDQVLSMQDASATATYWYYLKVMTSTLKSCPPEFLHVMGNLAKSLMDNMPQT